VEFGPAPQHKGKRRKGMLFTLVETGYWQGIKDGDPRAFDLFRRHYSYQDYADRRRNQHGYRNRFLICGPGEKLVLLGADERALFVWRKFICDGQAGVNCAVFRNESDLRSSDLIREAAEIAWRRWPKERLFTYVNPRMVRSNNPGYCFLKAGWSKCGITKWNKLLILECSP
jgi:hypothetical protein